MLFEQHKDWKKATTNVFEVQEQFVQLTHDVQYTARWRYAYDKK